MSDYTPEQILNLMRELDTRNEMMGANVPLYKREAQSVATALEEAGQRAPASLREAIRMKQSPNLKLVANATETVEPSFLSKVANKADDFDVDSWADALSPEKSITKAMPVMEDVAEKASPSMLKNLIRGAGKIAKPALGAAAFVAGMPFEEGLNPEEGMEGYGIENPSQQMERMPIDEADMKRKAIQKVRQKYLQDR